MKSIEPYENELLNSWLIRIAKINYTSQSNITNYIFKKEKLYTRDLDLYKFNTQELWQLKRHTKLLNITQHQLFKYETYLESSISIKGRHRWLTPLEKVLYKTNTFYGLRFCPLCLKKSVYLRDIWRVMLINICLQHKCYLHNSCPNCNSNIRYPNDDIYQAMYACHKCNIDFRNIKPEYISNKSKEYLVQQKLLNILNIGYFKVNNRYFYSFLLFDVIKIVMRNIIHTQKYSKKFIEQFSTKELSYLITYTFILLSNFPKRLNRFYSKHKFTNLHSILDKKRENLQNIPFWYISNISYNNQKTTRKYYV